MADTIITITLSLKEENVLRIVNAICGEDNTYYLRLKKEDETRNQFTLRRIKEMKILQIKRIVKEFELSPPQEINIT